MKNLTFDQLVDEIEGRSADELGELAELTRHYATMQRRTEILENAGQGMEDWKNGKLKAYDNIDELMQSLGAA